MITIKQLLESVDLYFEPRWVTKNETGVVELWEKKPNKTNYGCWSCYGWQTRLAVLKLAEFDGKDWTECIYEVPRKEEPKDKIKIGTLYIDKNVTFGDGDDDDVGVALEDYEVPRKTTGKIEKLTGVLPIVNGRRKIVFPSDVSQEDVISKLHEVIDVVNELKGAKNE